MNEPIDAETLLDRFRDWLDQARTETEREPAEIADDEDAGEPVGLYRLVEEFTALRHEVKLQTKGSRGLQEQAEALLPALKQAIDQMRGVEPREAQAVWLAARPLAESLADLDEALDRGRTEIDKARRQLVDQADADLVAALNALHAGQSWFRRRLAAWYHQAVLDVVQRHGPAARRPLFDALLEGYALIQTRLHRAMDAERLRRIDTLGKPVDPALMTVVAVVDAPERSRAEVVDELRRGYTWRGRVLRYAEVRVSREPARPRPDDPADDVIVDDDDASDLDDILDPDSDVDPETETNADKRDDSGGRV